MSAQKRYDEFGDEITPSSECKDLGFTLEYASKFLGEKECGGRIVTTRTLYNWFYNKPELFAAVIHGIKHLQR